MVTLGQRLKAEREKRGLTIEKLAAETRIHARYFEAIEEDRTADLPSGFFYRSFLRQYARILGLPESDYSGAIQRSLDAEAEQLDAQETALPQRNIVVPPMPTGRFNAGEEAKRWLTRLAVLVLVSAGASGVYYLYQHWIAPASGLPIAQESREPEQRAAESQAQPIAPAPQAPGEVKPEAPATPPVSGAADFSVAGTGGGAVPPAGEPGSALNLTLVASADSWIHLTADGRTIFMDVLKAGQARVFRGSSFMRLRTGNAGGFSMEFNGAAVPPAGPIGQVRTIEFTSEGARVVTPPPVKPEVTPLPFPQREYPD